MMADLPGATERVSQLLAAGLIHPSPRADRPHPYAIDTRDSVSATFRRLAIDAIEQCMSSAGEVQLAAVANSGTLLCALWAGATHRPFWNVLVDSPRSRGFGRQVEPDEGVTGTRFLLLDNHARSGGTLRDATRILEAHGGVVQEAAVFTAGEHVDYDRPLSVALPHHTVMALIQH